MKWMFFWVFLVGLLLRLLWIDSYPVGFTPDEASFGYDAYSLLKTGKDQWGETLPIILRSFGDAKLPLYSYILIPFVWVFGLNEFSVRLPNALLGSLSIIVVYILYNELFKDKKGALLASLLLAISPWHIALSRGAFEANLTTFLLPLGIFAFLKGLKNSNWLVISAFAFGLNVFSYHTARLLTPVIVGLIMFIYRKDLAEKYKLFNLDIKAFLSLVVLVGLVFVGTYTMFGAGLSRGSDVAIFNPTSGWGVVSEKQYQAIQLGLPEYLEKIFNNKAIFTLDTFISNYVSYYSPQFLFTNGPAEGTYGMIQGRGVMYLFEAIFIVWAFVSMFKKNSETNQKALMLILVWLVISAIPASLAKGPGYAANRASFMVPGLQILSAFGGVGLLASLSTLFANKLKNRFVYLCFIGAIVVSSIFFVEDYVFHSPVVNAKSMLYGRGEAVSYVQEISNSYEKIVLSRSLSEPHIFVAFYTKIDPTFYQSESQDWLKYQKENKTFVDQLGSYKLGKYVFEDINFRSRLNSKVLLVGKPDEFPDNITPLKTIYYPDKTKSLLIVDPQRL